MATRAELPRPPLERAPTPDGAYPLSAALHGSPSNGRSNALGALKELRQQRRRDGNDAAEERGAGGRSGELSTSSWTRRLDLYLAQYDHEGDARGRGRGGVDAVTGSGRTPLGHIDDNLRLRYVHFPFVLRDGTFSCRVRRESRPPFPRVPTLARPVERRARCRLRAATPWRLHVLVFRHTLSHPPTTLSLIRNRSSRRSVSPSSRDPATPSTFAGYAAARAPPPPPPRDDDAPAAAAAAGKDGDVMRRLNERLTAGLHFSSRGSSAAAAGRGNAGGGAAAPAPADAAVYQPSSTLLASFPATHDATAAIALRRRARSSWTAGGGDALTTTTRAGAGAADAVGYEAAAGAGAEAEAEAEVEADYDYMPSAGLLDAVSAPRCAAAERQHFAAAERAVAAFHRSPGHSLSPVKTKRSNIHAAAAAAASTAAAAAATANTDYGEDYGEDYGDNIRASMAAAAATSAAAVDSEDDEYGADAYGAAGGVGGVLSYDDDADDADDDDDAVEPIVTPLNDRRGPYASKLMKARSRRREANGGGGATRGTAGGVTAGNDDELAPDSPEAFEASRIDKLLEGLGAVLPTAGLLASPPGGGRGGGGLSRLAASSAFPTSPGSPDTPVGLYNLNSAYHSLKPPGFNP
jgi:hypothetical protein